MDLLKEATHYLAITIFFGYAFFQAYQISQRSGKHMLLHLFGFGGVDKHMTRHEKLRTWAVIAAVLFLMFVSTDMRKLASTEVYPQQGGSTNAVQNN